MKPRGWRNGKGLNGENGWDGADLPVDGEVEQKYHFVGDIETTRQDKTYSFDYLPLTGVDDDHLIACSA